SGIKAKGTLHWVSIQQAVKAEVRLYDTLFTDPTPTEHEGRDFMEFFNPNSLQTVTAFVEPSLQHVKAGTPLQFMRIGYFTADRDTTTERPVFNRTVTLKDGFKKKK
ncbi:MAG: glutamine--tRNA ligase, partial [Bacteroidota bacterium]